jgi:predicted nucleotidyltransferase
MPDTAIIELEPREAEIVRSILLNRIPNRPVWVFGSRANGKARRRSDLDLAVGGATPLTLRERALLADDFDASDLPIRVDVVDLNAATQDFKQRIERDFVLLFAGAAKTSEGVLA